MCSLSTWLQLEALAREAPTFLRIESQTPLRDAGAAVQHQGPRIMVRIDRGADLDAVRKGLSDVAARAAVELNQLMNPQEEPAASVDPQQLDGAGMIN